MSIDWNKVYNKAADKMTTRVPTAAPSAGKQTFGDRAGDVVGAAAKNSETVDLDAQIRDLESQYETLRSEQVKLRRTGITSAGRAEELGRQITDIQKQMETLKAEKVSQKYATKTHSDTFPGQFAASYDLGKLTQDSALAWNTYLDTPTAENRAAAERASELVGQFSANNQDALTDNATLPVVSQSLAGYLPQLSGQIAHGGGGAALGAAIGSVVPIVGTALGAKIGATAGSGSYTYQTMRGAAFEGLVKAGVDEEIARAAANDEAVVSSLIEMADTGLDIATLGAGKLMGNLLKGGVKAVSSEAAEGAAKKLLKALVGYGVNIGGEMLQEGVQESVSIANAERAKTGETGKLNLAGRTGDVLLDAILGTTQQSLANRKQILGAAKEGGKLAAMVGGATLAGNTAANAAVNRLRSAELRAQEGAGVSSSGKKTPAKAVSAPSAVETNEGLAAAQILAQELAAAGQEKTAPKAGAADDFVNVMVAEAQRLFGQEKDTTQTDTVQRSDRDTYTVVAKLKESIPALSVKNPVAKTSVKAIDAVAGKTMAEKAKRLFEAVNGVVTRPGFGDVEINGRSAKDDLSHGVGAAKAATISAVPQVIRDGEAIHFEKNWKNRGYDGYIFAAPVDMDGSPVYVAAVVKKSDKNKFYLHEVVDSNGNIIKIDDGESATPTSLATNGDAGTLDPSPTSDTTITHPSDSVNTADGGRNAVGAAAAGSVNTDYDALQAQSRSFHPEGANVAEGRHVEVPTKDFEGRNISRFASNAMGAKALSEDTVQAIERLVAAGALSDDVQTNTETMRRAEDEINKITVGGAMERLRNAAATGETSPELMGMMEALLVDAEAKGDGARKSELLYLGARLSRSSGRSLQMLSHLRKMDPAYQLQIIDRLVESVNKDIASKRSAAPKKKATRNPNTDTSRRHRQISSGNVPVEQWMEKTGELLARKLGSAVKKNTATEQTVSQRVLADLRRLAKETVEPAKRAAGSRTEMDSIYDMFHNQEQYEKALAAAKATVADEYGSDPAVMAALEQWMQTAFDYTTQFTKAVTGQEAIRVPEDLRQRYLAAETAQQRNEVISDIQQYVADNIPSTVGDVFTAIRYTNMLGNLKTPIRNTVGNVSMRLLAEINNAIAAGIEQAAGGKVGRTRSVVVNRNLLNAAKADYDAHKDSIEGARRYSDSLTATDAFMQGVQDKRRVIQLPGMFGRSENSSGVKKAVRKAADTVLLPMEAYRKGTSWIMDNQFFGDTAFLKGSYARSLAGYLKANGVTAAQFTDPAWQAKNGDLVKDARTFAVQQAKENTFRDNNSLSDWVSKVGRRKDTPWYARMVAEGFMPFRKTPANVLVRAEEYSPLGFVNATVKALQKANGTKVTGNDIVNSLSKALTGSALFGLGWLLKNTGWLRSTEEDEEQAAFDDLTGHQDYSMILPDGTSLTVDWLTPTSMPVFMGAKLSEILQDNDLSWKDVESVITSMADPMLQMSMLSGVQDTLDDIKFSDNSTIQMVVSTALGYLTQGLSNTLLGQLERATQETRKTTYVEHDSNIPDWLQREIGSLFGKIPGKDFQQIDYIDAWGRTEENFEDPLVRVLYETMSPSYISKVDVDAVEAELQRLKDAVPDEEDLTFFPARAGKSFEVDGETKYLTADEYVRYAKAKGQNSYALVQSAIHSPAYKAMSDAEKAAFVTKMYGYANYKAKKTVAPEYESDTYRKYAEAEAVGMSPAEYYVMTNTYDYDGSSSTGQPTQAEAQRYLDTETDLSNSQKADLWTIINKSWTKNNPYA